MCITNVMKIMSKKKNITPNIKQNKILLSKLFLLQSLLEVVKN